MPSNQEDRVQKNSNIMRHKTSKYLIAIVCIFASAILSAQSDENAMQIDTSYFQKGNSDFNFIEAVSRNQYKTVEMLLERGISANTVSSTGNSALMYATETGNIELMELLLNYGADINASGYKLETPLFIAIFKNDFQAAKYLLEHGANPNVKDFYGVTPLIYAAATNQYQSADLLMFYDADEKITDSKGNDPLIAAVTFENIETSDVLLQNEMDPDVQDNDGNTPLIIATQRARYDIIDLLLDYQADVNISNKKGYTPLAYAIIYNDYRASEMLINNGADTDHKVNDARNMADLAFENGNDSIKTLLKSTGATLSTKPDFSEFRMTYGNSFNATDYFIQFRGGFADSKYGFYFETGIDYRPFLLKIHIPVNDTLYQFRERRIGWSHSFGKHFRLYRKNQTEFSVYTSLAGLLSFPRYSGSSNENTMEYKVIPSAGITYLGNVVGVKAGMDWYQFENTLDRALKFNVSLIIRINYPTAQFDRKEIFWE